ncbi:MAG: Bax inhibitor-1/YccA family protein [Flavobacteriaceae bacterium]|nr:Bax inhibitor-1/YccA family protein [Flavobacteriaceae bacterium]
MEYQQNTIIQVREQQAAFIAKVYMWMSLALVITGLTSYVTATSPALLSLMFSVTEAGLKPTFLFYALILGELGLVVFLSAAIQRMTGSLATAVFLLYSFINGMTLSMVFLAYTGSSIATTFFITAGTFAVMSLYGYYTKKDLTSWGRILFMALIGIIIASLVNLFMRNAMMDWVISLVGVLVFVGLIAYDTQRLKMLGIGIGTDGDMENHRKASILGALTLYLDFINLFLFLLRFFGGNRK